jgi:hypothetical protein
LFLVLAPTIVKAKEPVFGDIPLLDTMFGVLAEIPDTKRDVNLRASVLFHACGESTTCADGCEQQLLACADPQLRRRADILSSCPTFASRARGRKGEKPNPEAWIEERMKSFANAVEKIVPPRGLAEFRRSRLRAKL